MSESQLTKHQRWELRKQEKERLRGASQRQQSNRKITRIVLRSIFLVLVGIAGWYFIDSRSAEHVPQAELLKIQSDDWVKGGRTAVVTLVEYADFQCPACASYHPLIKQLADEYGDAVAIVFRHFPLASLHPNALAAAVAAEAAGAQGKFFEMHDRLFTLQGEWGNSRNAPDLFSQYAVALGLDNAIFVQAANSSESRAAVLADEITGKRLGVNGTPTFFLNGQQIPNFRNYAELKTLVDAALLTSSISPMSAVTSTEAVHRHADFKVYINNSPIDFTQDKYQSTDDHELSHDTHLHDGNGDMLHVHVEGVTMTDFLKTLGITLTADCLTMDTGTPKCSNGSAKLKFYVNGQLGKDPATHVMNDLDQILVSYGSEADTVIEQQLKSITDIACIYSEVCPERGTPPTENCVGGLGSKC